MKTPINKRRQRSSTQNGSLQQHSCNCFFFWGGGEEKYYEKISEFDLRRNTISSLIQKYLSSFGKYLLHLRSILFQTDSIHPCLHVFDPSVQEQLATGKAKLGTVEYH